MITRVIYNKHFPFGPFFATNICGIIFCRSDKGRLGKIDINHESIHSMQQREMLYVGFMLWYAVEWAIRFLKTGKFMKAYYDSYMEREAYANERNLDYLSNRRPYAWWHQCVKPGTLLHEIGEAIGEIHCFLHEDFRLFKYLYALLFALCIIVGQVAFHFYDWAMAPSYDDGTSMLRLSLIYIGIYYLALIPTVLMHGDAWRLRQWQVWVFPAFLIAVDGMGQGFDYYREWISNLDIYHKERYYLTLIGSFFFRSVWIISMLCLFRFFTTGRFGLYGLVRSSKYLRVYGLIYLTLLPIFVIVSMTPQFLDFYPKMDIGYCSGSFGWPDWKTIGVFELCYANDFLGVESMFRGALVIGLSRWLGPRAVLPMVLVYMSIHLGKPDLELCSSMIGGYILGILAYRTQHLWGGIIIHLGIALLFEALGMIMRQIFL